MTIEARAEALSRAASTAPAARNKPLVGRMRFRFGNPIVDGYFSYVLAFGARGGADVGEAFYAATRIRQYDPESWVAEFTGIAERVAGLAETALSRGHAITGRDALLRAAHLDRAALMALSPLRDAERYRRIRDRSRARFRDAFARQDPPIEAIEVPFGDLRMPGYFVRCDTTGARRPTLLVVGGGDSMAEDIVLAFGLGDGPRGWNVLTVDLPGQGTTPLDGQRMTPEVEPPMRALVDWAVAHPEVDADRLAAVGMSLGGYILPRAAIADPRIKAIVVNSIILDLHDYLVQARELQMLARLERMPGFRLVARLFGSWLAGLFNVMDNWKWKWGAASIADWLEMAKAYRFDPAGIRCPTLLLVGEDEYAYPASRRFQHEALAAIGNPTKNLVIGRADLGAGGKNLLPNINAIRAHTFDWLDEVFGLHGACGPRRG